MSFSKGKHWVRAVIEDRYQFLCLLIDLFNTQAEEYENDVAKQISILAEEIADGDEEIEVGEKSKLLLSFANSQDNRNLFYQSMLIMGYSYYESSLGLIEQELGKQCQNTNNYNINSTKIQTNKKWIKLDVRLMRNFLVHNNSVKPTKKQDEAIKRLQSKYPGIHYDGNGVTITSDDCVVDFLNTEYEVLKNLCLLVGFN